MKSAAAESANEKKKGRMEGRIQLEFTERRKERKGGPPNVQRGDERREIWNCETRGEERRGAGKGTREGNAARPT